MMYKRKIIIYLLLLLLPILIITCRKDSFSLSNKSIAGIKNGIYATYYQNGNKKKVVHYHNGYPHGVARGFYSDKKLFWQVSYESGEKNGLQYIYYRNGRIKSKTTFNHGKIDGIIKKYRRDGRLEYLIPYRDNRIYGAIIHYTYYNKSTYSEKIQLGSSRKRANNRLDNPVWLRDERTDLDYLSLPQVGELPESDAVKKPIFNEYKLNENNHQNILPELNNISNFSIPTDQENDPYAYPNKSIQEDEAWQYQLMEKGENPDIYIKKGI